MKRKYGIIGDVHLGFKAYDSNRRSEECIAVFENGIQLLYDEGVRVIGIAGDLCDDTVWPNWIEKRAIGIFRKFYDVIFVIDGGNHDVTKTYSSVSALDVLDELDNVHVVNNFEVEYLEEGGLTWVAVPHMKSQKDFIAALEKLANPGHIQTDVLLLHCMVDSNLDLSPNDLNVTTELLGRLSKVFNNIWIGHQHVPVDVSRNVIIPGSTLELSFGEIAERYVYVCEEGVITRLTLPQPREMVKHEYEWDNLEALFNILDGLNPGQIHKLIMKHIPQEFYGQAVAAVEATLHTFKGDLMYDLIKTGHTSVEISTIDVRFNLLEEFDDFCKDNGVDDPLMRNMLQDAMAEIAGEEEDLVL